MHHELIAILMFLSMMVMLITGQRVFGAIGFVATVFALMLWGTGGVEMPFSAAFKLFNWYPLLTLPLFIYMGYMLSESGIASDLYHAFHVWFGPLRGGLAIGTIGLMVVISAMNGLSVAGMAIGASIALPEMLRRGYDKIMITGVVQAGSSLGILVPPSVVLVLYGMIARQPVGQLWLAGVFPGLLLAGLFMLYIVIRCKLQPKLGPPLAAEERQIPLGEKLKLLRAGILPFLIFFFMTGLFLMGITSLVESSAVGAVSATIAAIVKRRMTRQVMEDTVRKSLGVSCMFMWVILAALAFGAVFDGLGAVRADHDAALLPADGNVSGRYRDARHRCAIVCAAGDQPRLRSHLVWRPLHDHLSDRVHDPAFRLQSFSHARHGASRDITGGHLPIDRAVRAGHVPGVGAGDDISTDCPVAAQSFLRQLKADRA